MADGSGNENIKSSGDAAECSEANIEIKLKTLDSQTYNIQVDKNIPVIALKEKIVGVTGVPVDQQRLICRGRVLKNEHRLSDYSIENGHTLHLVVRQPATSAAAGPSGTDGGAEQGNDSAARNRSGQVSHNVVFGSFNLQEQGDGGFPDLNRILSTVLTSIGMGNIAPVNAGAGGTPAPHGVSAPEQQQNENLSNGQRETANQQQPGLVFSNIQVEPLLHNFQAFAATQQRGPTSDWVIPDAISTIGLYLNRIEQSFAHNGFNNQHGSSSSEQSSNRQESGSSMSSTSRVPLTPASLGSVINRTIQLLTGPARLSFSQFAGQLEGEASVAEPSTRSQIQSLAMWNGIMMQEMGALLLELGRATLTLRMGQSHAESIVNSGPAVYISPDGPNPIMVQAQNFQRTGILGAFPPAILQPNLGVPTGPMGVGDVPRNISIYIHPGSSMPAGAVPVTSLSNNQSGTQGTQPQSGQTGQTAPGNQSTRESGSIRMVPVRTVVAAVPAAFPARPSEATASGTLNVFYPQVHRYQQMRSGQGVPIPAVSQISTNSSTPSTQPQGSEAFQVPPAMPHIQVQTHNGNTDAQTMNPLSTPSMFSASAIPNTLLETPRQPGTTGLGESRHQESGSYNSTAGDNNRRSQGNTDGNTDVSSGNEMANLVGSVMQQMLTSFRSETENQSQTDQVNTVSNASNLNASAANEDQKLPGTSDNENEAALSEIHTNDAANNSTTKTDTQNQIHEIVDLETSGKAIDTECDQQQTNHQTTTSAAPVGLGLGGLQPLPSKRVKQTRKQKSSNLSGSDGQSGSNSREASITMGQNVLKALVSPESSSHQTPSESRSATRSNLNPLAEMLGNMTQGGPSSNGEFNIGQIMSQLIQNPNTLNNLVNRAVQMPGFANAVEQISGQLGEQVQDLDTNFSGQGQGGIDLASLMQQMAPIVSQVMGRPSGSTSSCSPEDLMTSNSVAHVPPATNGGTHDQDIKGTFEPIIERLENKEPPEELLSSVVERAVADANDGFSDTVDTSDLVNHLNGTDGLANEYCELLQRDLSKRLHSNSKPTDRP